MWEESFGGVIHVITCRCDNTNILTDVDAAGFGVRNATPRVMSRMKHQQMPDPEAGCSSWWIASILDTLVENLARRNLMKVRDNSNVPWRFWISSPKSRVYWTLEKFIQREKILIKWPGLQYTGAWGRERMYWLSGGKKIGLVKGAKFPSFGCPDVGFQPWKSNGETKL